MSSVPSDGMPRIVIDEIAAHDDDVTRGVTTSAGFLKGEDERGRARSIDFGRLFSGVRSRNHGNEKDSLLCSDDELSPKEKSKSRLMKKFNSVLRKGSDAQKTVKARQGSLDFSNATPHSLFSLSSSSINKSDELPVPVPVRRGSLFVQPKGTIEYKVEPEDTLASLAARYKSTVAELKSLNRLMSNLLFPGQTLFVPDGDSKEVRRASDFSVSSVLSVPGVRFKSQSRPCSPVALGKVDEEDASHEKKGKKTSFFSGEAKYMTGGKTNLSGLLTISGSEVRFDPYLRRSEGSETVPDEINTIIGLVRYKMSAACRLHSAIFQVDDPFERKPEPINNHFDEHKKAVFTIGSEHEEDNNNNNDDDDEVEKEANFLRLTLVRKMKSDRPFVEALVKMCIPGPNFMEHFFVLKPKISHELRSFLRAHFPDKLNAPVPDPSTLKVMDIKVQVSNSTLRRKLSIAELCNLALPQLSDSSHIFNDGHVRVLREFLPPKFDGRPWQLAYSTWKHGFSLKTLYRCLDQYKKEEVALMTIKDTCSEVFGGMLCGAVRKSESFYGTGESFLFTFSPSFQIYPWSRKNECFARGTHDCFIMGSSRGALGLWIDEDLLHGSSSPCDTFDNDPLTSASNFTISCLEVWTFPYELS